VRQQPKRDRSVAGTERGRRPVWRTASAVWTGTRSTLRGVSIRSGGSGVKETPIP
jgi:hypothetical protein